MHNLINPHSCYVINVIVIITNAITKQDFLLLSIRTNFITECFLLFKILIFKIHKVEPF